MRKLIVAGTLVAAVTIGGIPWATEASAAGPGTCRAGFHPVTTQFHHGVAAGRDANGNGFICIRSQRLGVFAVEDDQV